MHVSAGCQLSLRPRMRELKSKKEFFLNFHQLMRCAMEAEMLLKTQVLYNKSFLAPNPDSDIFELDFGTKTF